MVKGHCVHSSLVFPAQCYTLKYDFGLITTWIWFSSSSQYFFSGVFLPCTKIIWGLGNAGIMSPLLQKDQTVRRVTNTDNPKHYSWGWEQRRKLLLHLFFSFICFHVHLHIQHITSLQSAQTLLKLNSPETGLVSWFLFLWLVKIEEDFLLF